MFEIILLSSIIFVINVGAVFIYTYINSQQKPEEQDKRNLDVSKLIS